MPRLAPVHSRDDAEPAQENVLYRQGAIRVTDDELAELVEDIEAAVAGVGDVDWVRLTQWVGVTLGVMCWTIDRRAPEARRFNRVVVQMYADP